MAASFREANATSGFTAATSQTLSAQTYLPLLQVGDLVYALVFTTGNSAAMSAPTGWTKLSGVYSTYGYGVCIFVTTNGWQGGSDTWTLSSSQASVFGFIAFAEAAHSSHDVSGILYDNSADTVGEWGSVTVPAEGHTAALCARQGSTDPVDLKPTGYVDAYSAVAASTRAIGLFYNLVPSGAGGTENPADTTSSNNVSFHLMVSFVDAATARAERSTLLMATRPSQIRGRR